MVLLKGHEIPDLSGEKTFMSKYRLSSGSDVLSLDAFCFDDEFNAALLFCAGTAE